MVLIATTTQIIIFNNVKNYRVLQNLKFTAKIAQVKQLNLTIQSCVMTDSAASFLCPADNFGKNLTILR